MLSDQQFERARWLALNVAGIQLVERHRELLERWSLRAGMNDHTVIKELPTAVESGDLIARGRFLGLLTSKFTGFLRPPRHLEIAAQHALQFALRGALLLTTVEL